MPGKNAGPVEDETGRDAIQWQGKLYPIYTLNQHIDVAGDTGDLRLLEATGVGTLLVTDWKKNLHEMFEPSKEVVAYRTSQECVEMIQYYLEHDEERQAIARAGHYATIRIISECRSWWISSRNIFL